MAKVFVKIPRTGLGNMLLVWAHGIVFARINNFGIITSAWWGFRWGALLRREKRNRLYRHYFKEASFVKRKFYRASFLFSEIVSDPDIEKLNSNNYHPKTVFVFEKAIRQNDLFKDLRDHKDLIKSELYKILDDKIKRKINHFHPPVIGVHIRRGDFKLGNQTTPLHYYRDVINYLRKETGVELPVTVFTDADESEIEEILKLPSVMLAEEKPDILDLLVLSWSKILILSKDSTFSYWAAFLSEALIIMPSTDWQSQIRFCAPGYQEVRWNISESLPPASLGEALKLNNLLPEKES